MYIMRSKFFKMMSIRFISIAQSSTFSLAHSSRDNPGRIGSQELGAELSIWKPSWLHRSLHLASLKHLITVLLARIWYGQCFFFWYITVIGLVTCLLKLLGQGVGLIQTLLEFI